MIKKTLSLILAFAMSIACICTFAGCDVQSGTGGTSDTTAAPLSPSEEPVAIATVGGENIYLHEFESAYNMYVEYYANYGYDITTDEATLVEFKESLLDRMIAEKAALIKAKQLGLDDFTEEQLQEIDDSIAAEYKSIEEYYRPLAKEQAGSDDEVAIQAKYEELVANESIEYTGVQMSYDEYLEYVKTSITESYLINLYKEEVVYKDLTVSDDSIQASYSEYLEADKKAYTENPASYKNDQESAELLESMPTAYTPEGYSRILSILVVPQVQKSEAYTTNESAMDKLESEYGSLAFEDAISGKNTNSARLKEIIAQYNELKAANDAENASTNEIYKARAEEAYAKLQGGAAFLDVMSEYTEDPDFDADSIFLEKGVLISTKYNAESDLSSEVKAAFKNLKKGEYSPVFEDEDGFHIIYYLADEPSGERSLDELKPFIEEELLTSLKTTEWDALVEAWTQDAEFVTIDQELLDGVR